MTTRSSASSGGAPRPVRRWQQLGLAAVGLWSLAAAGVVGSAGCRLTVKSASLAVAAQPTRFVLDSTQGSLDSAVALANGPLVLIFYRGHW